MYLHITVLLLQLLEYGKASRKLPSLLPGKCYSCSSENILKRWPQDGSNHIHYLRQLPILQMNHAIESKNHCQWYRVTEVCVSNSSFSVHPLIIKFVVTYIIYFLKHRIASILSIT
ncbi:hypothetical protein WUBG_11978 [Wuchereria bancrofti]|uniref:Uncharacterized protein n=1 Tax=Wuchereria bancrofti TaxID=6293 RepID=J9ARU9_WUCBA|nr:hypothetical protein WUBG_11978 [Wuchereria bancrofti]